MKLGKQNFVRASNTKKFWETDEAISWVQLTLD